MLVKLLNKIGLYTARQMRELSFYVDAVEARVNKYVLKCKKLEDENEKLKLKIAKSVKRRRR